MISDQNHRPLRQSGGMRDRCLQFTCRPIS